MGFFALILLALLLFCCGYIGWIILFILCLVVFLTISESWLSLILILILLAIGIGLLLYVGGVFNTKTKRETSTNTNTPKSLEINNETIKGLVKLVGQMPDDGTPLYQSDAKGITSVEWGLYQDWLRRNADEYVITVGYSIIRVKSKADKIKLINKLLNMKTDGVD